MLPDATDAANLNWFREAAPYLQALRGATFVLAWTPGDSDDANRALLGDCTRHAALGSRIVLVKGIRDALDRALAAKQSPSRFHKGIRITPAHDMPCVQSVAGSERLSIEARLSASALASQFDGKRLPVATCNAVSARPYGVHDGVDHGCTGVVRRVDTAHLRAQLDGGALVLQSPVAWAPSGELYNLRHEELATEIAIALRADKLIFLARHTVVQPVLDDGQRDLTPATADRWCEDNGDTASALALRSAATACRRGVTRAYLLDADRDGALPTELLTRDGAGAMVSADNYEGLRAAAADDVPGLVELTAPLVSSGSLVARAVEQFEVDIGHFAVVERDGLLVACAALLPHACGLGEFCCLATHPDYRNGGRAAKLLAYCEASARNQGLKALFVLTTQTADWFLEREFRPGETEQLPPTVQARYSPGRNSKVLIKAL
ncbi:MAG: amino-acid N-acetyltransferase [Pseudomonadota bacterium]